MEKNEKEKLQEVIVATLVSVTPNQLRELATLLELSVQRTTASDTILVKLTDKIMLSYKPPLRTDNQRFRTDPPPPSMSV